MLGGMRLAHGGLSCWSTLMATVTVSGSWGGTGTAPPPPQGCSQPSHNGDAVPPIRDAPGTGRSTALRGGWLRDILELRSLLTAGQAHSCSVIITDTTPTPPPSHLGLFPPPQALGRPSGALRTQSPAFRNWCL